mmetsp:Transcript_11861/g.16569  ORF Transcript_11861/g.16569 Transcript_11861/m.16569 type:complete len:123 (+) Transcript_11861:503-871(+)
MVKREREMRLSSAWQGKMETAEQQPDTDWIEVVEELQKEVVKEHEVLDIPLGISVLRTAHRYWPSLQPCMIQVRYNRAVPGTLSIGSSIPELKLYSLDGREVPLVSNQWEKDYLCLIAGSRS